MSKLVADDAATRLQLIVNVPTKAKLIRLGKYRGCSIAALVEQWAATAERQVTADLSSESLTRYYDGE